MPLSPQELQQIARAVAPMIQRPGGGGSSSLRREIKRLKREIAELEAEIANLDTSSETVVQASTIGNVDLSTDLAAGNDIDGYTLVEGDLVLVQFQADRTENGVYVVPAAGAASRAEDWDEDEDFRASRSVSVQNGDYWSGYFFQNRNNSITLGVDGINFSEVIDNDLRLMRILDDFDQFTSGSNFLWLSGGSGSSFPLTGEPSAPGILEITVAAGGGTQRAEIWSSETIDLSGATEKFRLEMVARQNGAWEAGVDDGITNIGLLNRTFGNPPDDGVYFSQRSAEGLTWLIGAADGGARTEEDTGLSVNPDFELFTIDVLPGASSIRFFNNRVEVTGSPISTNIPTALIGRTMETIFLGGAAGRTLGVDRYDLRAYVSRSL